MLHFIWFKEWVQNILLSVWKIAPQTSNEMNSFQVKQNTWISRLLQNAKHSQLGSLKEHFSMGLKVLGECCWEAPDPNHIGAWAILPQAGICEQGPMSSWGHCHQESIAPLMELAIYGRHRHSLCNTDVVIKIWRHMKDFPKEVIFALRCHHLMPPQTTAGDRCSLGQALRLHFLSLPP